MSFIVSEIILIYASDGQEMDNYLSEQFEQMIEYPLYISHKRIEDIDENYENIIEYIGKSNAVILILSPDFLNTIYILSEKVYKLCQHLRPTKTLLMFFGCNDSDLSEIQKSLLYGYQSFHRLVDTVSDVKQFLINAINYLLNILQLNKFGSNALNFAKKRHIFSTSPQFELSIEQIFEPNQKIYILLDSAIEDDQRIHLSIGVSNDILTVERKNPFTLCFTIPEYLVKCNEYLEISLICGHKDLGERRIKCWKSHSIDDNNNDNYRSDSQFDSIDSTNSYRINKNWNQIPIPKKRSQKRLSMISRRIIYLNDDDFYLLPETNGLNHKTANLSRIASNRSLSRTEFERKYSIYDIPRSIAQLTSDEREVYV